MSVQFLDRADSFRDNVAIIDNNGLHTYFKLSLTSKDVASEILNHLQGKNTVCIAFMMPASFDYVCAQRAIWYSSNIAVPVCTTHPAAEIQYIIEDTDCSVFIADKRYKAILSEVNFGNCKLIWWDELLFAEKKSENNLPDVKNEQDALIVYTSGTTGKPKGVVLTHDNLRAQMMILTEAWAWKQDDLILNVLPLHHIHGIVNVLCCALWSGATCEMHEKFDAAKTWQWLLQDEIAEKIPSVFMAVPTVYHKLIQHYETLDLEQQNKLSAACKRLRLMVSGSAALPVSLLEKWKVITGHFLLERYGMSETGMILSNSYAGERLAGFVGKPLPHVEVKLIDQNGIEITKPEIGGEILVKGYSVFKEYYNKPEATEQAFDSDGWFITGDVAIKNADGNFKILGRKSTDIIKSGGYKISALEIESVLLQYDAVSECAIVGLPDDEWGEVIAAAIVLNDNSKINGIENAIQSFCQNKLAAYKLPRKFFFATSLPRNAMGKVIKQEVKLLFN